jgi:hypothetical protein
MGDDAIVAAEEVAALPGLPKTSAPQATNGAHYLPSFFVTAGGPRARAGAAHRPPDRRHRPFCGARALCRPRALADLRAEHQGCTASLRSRSSAVPASSWHLRPLKQSSGERPLRL